MNDEKLASASWAARCWVGRMPRKVSDVLRMLDDDGWYLVRTTGSHRHFKHQTKAGIVTVAGKPSKTLPIGTERSILKQAGLLGRSQ